MLWHGAAYAQTPPDPGANAQRVERFLTAINSGDDEDSAREFLLLDNYERLYSVLHDAWPRIESAEMRVTLLNLIAQDAEGGDENDTDYLPRRYDSLNPHLLDILRLGMSDKQQSIQITALHQLNRLTGLRLTAKTYPAWVAENGSRSLEDIARASVTDMVKRLTTEKEGMRAYLLDRLRRMTFVSTSRTLQTPEAQGVVALNLTAVRRQAALDAGLLETLAAILHAGANPDAQPAADVQPKNAPAIAPNSKPNTQNLTPNTLGASAIVRRKALALLSVFKADPAFLSRVEPDVKREYAARVPLPYGLQGVSPALLLAYTGDWALAMLNRQAEAVYLGPEAADFVRDLAATNDLRAVPIFLALMDQVEPQAEQMIYAALIQLTKQEADEQQSADWWRKWWAAKPAMISDSIRNQPVPHLLAPRDALLKRLTGYKNFFSGQALEQFQTLDPDTQYTLLRDHWTQIGSPGMRQQLINYAFRLHNPQAKSDPKTFGINPRLLDILDLGMTDRDPNVVSQARNNAYYVAGQRFAKPDEWQAWRTAHQGKSLPDIVREGCQNMVAHLGEGGEQNIRQHLQALMQIVRAADNSERTGRPDMDSTTKTFAEFRRSAILEAGARGRVADLLHGTPSRELQTNVLQFLAACPPDKAVLQRIEDAIRTMIDPLLKAKVGSDTRLYLALALYDTRWATDTLLTVIQTKYNDETAMSLTYALKNKTDPRLFPALIALLDAVQDTDWERAQIGSALAALAKLPPDTARDAFWWRNWWEKNKAKYPEEARKMEYPKIGLGLARARTYSIRSESRRITLPDAAKTTYWQLASGYLVTLPPAAHTVGSSPAGKPPELPEELKPGLLVVLAKDWDAVEKQCDYWLKCDERAFKGRYVIALVQPPNPQEKKALWPTGGANAKKGGVTTQASVAEIVRDVQARFPIRSARTYLLGIGEGGMAAYACSLQPGTPFKGSVIISGAFRSADLPPLANAKGRRYALLHNKADHTLPEFIQTATQQTLQKNGAALRRLDYEADAVQSGPAAPFDTIQAAVEWLETGR